MSAIPDEIFFGPPPPQPEPVPPPPTSGVPIPPPPILGPGQAVAEIEPGVFVAPPAVAPTLPQPQPAPVPPPTSGVPIPPPPILGPGQAVAEIEPGVFVAPPVVRVEGEEPVPEVPTLDEDDFRELEGVSALRGEAFVNYVHNGCIERRLDEFAAFAVIFAEGINGKIGDNGWAYGPTQDHLTQYKGRPWYGRGRNNHAVNVWAWSRKGADYWLDQMAKTGARGVSGERAIELIVNNYEKPQNIAQEIQRATDYYYAFVADKEKAYRLIADKAQGPTDTGEPDTGAIAVPVVPRGGSDAWQEFINFFRVKIPQAHKRMEDRADNLIEVVR